MCLVFISLKTALSYSPRVSGLLLFHHFSYCGSLFAVPKTVNAGQMDRAKDSTTLRNSARRNSNTRYCNSKNESLSRVEARTELRT